MSCNVTATSCVVKDARMLAGDIRDLLDAHEDDLPENNFLSDIEPGRRTPDDAWVPVEDIYWRGEGSGSRFHVLEEEILPKVMGSADIIFTWEGGDSRTALRVTDGVVVECDIVETLEPRMGKR